ncbi:YdcF family protein [Catenovulum sp. 2E275]|uniref:ElyC/SanA/YdcF family protein n=1 Tax=Catenovulum sp. 2E275 TaxID=2980497 RepID=UPI0021CDF6D3|nr:ElyC/SanA/YdcF family protein [Catenovulum sp. 2E275]MCU4675569.1 YdcF family protein [Catenovulum sp. 2E275]
MSLKHKNKLWLAKSFFISSLFLFTIASLPVTSFYLLRPLETAYPKYQDQFNHIDNIVVLGCYNSFDDEVPDISNIYPCSLYRLVEAVRLSLVYPKANILLSGKTNDEEGNVSHPEFSLKLLTQLGVDSARVVIINGPKDTEEEVLALKQHIQGSANLVISSASHFIRVVRLFEEYGIAITPVPIEYLTRGGEQNSWFGFIPNPDALKASQRACYEYLGITWIMIKSYLSLLGNSDEWNK